ncbi:vinculin isoform X3 [Ischnura elegans]|uniref:vinculin isoform X3 n=1 Tax=Ischnura elegans TaxID=197161 RepID=UPI001ED8AD0B|nr:vinculin isoform X3 [Ischnura elegans]
MPVFHTKTIESILEPVAQQVSRLVILHEEAEDGNAMPDLERPVYAVSRAVANLVKVGRETINSSDDPILKQDMPSALVRVEGASKFLEEASSMLKADPFSGPARKKLIEGSRGILQGTSALLLCFDESEVRKIIRECKRVLDYLAVAEVIETMEDLVQFLKDLSPCLSKVSREVGAREKELTHQVHREILTRCLEQVKTLAPILICSMKIFIHIIAQGGKGAEEAAENRNYLSQRMTDELNEIIRVLQLTTYDEDEWEADDLTVMKRSLNAIQGKMQAAHDWLEDPLALRGGVGEKSVRHILEQAMRVCERSGGSAEGEAVGKLVGDISSMTDALCQLRQEGKGTTPQAQSLSRAIQGKLSELQRLVATTVTSTERGPGGWGGGGRQQPAHTVWGRLEQARRWLENPAVDDRGLGRRAIALIVEEGKKVAEGLPGNERAGILALCDEVDSLSRQLADYCRHGQASSPQAQAIGRALSQKLHDLKSRIQSAVVSRVVEDFVDVGTPLKQFTDAVLAPEGAPGREQNFADKASALKQFSGRAARTARMVAAGGSGGNKKLAEALLASANQLESLTPQLVSAGRIRMAYPSSKAADEHFGNLRTQYADCVHHARTLCDEATDSAEFIKLSEEQMRRQTKVCEDSLLRGQAGAGQMVEGASNVARLANRVLMLAKQEADNSEDPDFIAGVNAASDSLQNNVTPMVQDAKAVAMNMSDHNAITRWRESNRALLSSVGMVRQAVIVTPDLPPPPDMSALHINAGLQEGPPDVGVNFGDIFNVDFNEIFAQPQRDHHPSANGWHKSPSQHEQNGANESQEPVHFFSQKVGQSLREQPSPSSPRGPSPGLAGMGRTSPRPISPFPVWARGGTTDLLYQELASDEEQKHYNDSLNYNQIDGDYAPPRPPLPGGEHPPPRPPPPPETDDEDDMFMHAPQPNQPIMMAAHGLHQEVRQWSSKDNDIIAAAKKMALLMGRLSQLVRGEGGRGGGMGTKRDLIACAKEIAEASEEVTRLAKELARECTDKRMRTNLLQVCERIPTIGTQLKILSTVKATMLGAQETIPRNEEGEIRGGTEEDKEATEMLVGNAQNLMQSVKETVRAAESASIKIRTDAGIRLRWVRKQPWYQY